MFNRQELKLAARKQLASRMLLPVLITLFTIAVSSTVSGSTRMLGKNLPALNFLVSFLSIVINGTLAFAAYAFYNEMRLSDEPKVFGDYINGFNLAPKAVCAVLWRALFIYLWAILCLLPSNVVLVSMLVTNIESKTQAIANISPDDTKAAAAFIINLFTEDPLKGMLYVILLITGICALTVKVYQYSLHAKIIVNHPQISVTHALNLSKTLTKGNKWNLFVMDLSFIGWYMLCILTLGVGLLWIAPYHRMTWLNAYAAIEAQALENKIIREEDLV